MFGVPRMANSPLNSMGINTVFDRAPLPRIGDLPNSLHTDLKFHNQAKYGKAVGRERAASVYATTRC